MRQPKNYLPLEFQVHSYSWLGGSNHNGWNCFKNSEKQNMDPPLQMMCFRVKRCHQLNYPDCMWLQKDKFGCKSCTIVLTQWSRTRPDVLAGKAMEQSTPMALEGASLGPCRLIPSGSAVSPS